MFVAPWTNNRLLAHFTHSLTCLTHHGQQTHTPEKDIGSDQKDQKRQQWLLYGVLSDRHSVDATAAAAAVLPRDQLPLTAVGCWRPFGYSHEANAIDGRVSERENRIRQH